MSTLLTPVKMRNPFKVIDRTRAPQVRQKETVCGANCGTKDMVCGANCGTKEMICGANCGTNERGASTNRLT